MDPNQVVRDADGAFRCRECGFRYALSASEIARVCMETVAGFSEAALAIPAPLRDRRTAPAVWSPNAYCAHMADAAELIEQRVRRMATEDVPFLPRYDQDAAAERGRFDEIPIEPSLQRVDSAVSRFVALVVALPAEGWHRTGIHEEAGEVKLTDIAHDMPHELTHHTGDLRRIGAEPQSVE